MSRKYFTAALIIVCCLSAAGWDLQAGPTDLELTSPKNEDHFEITKPLFFWKSVPAAHSYEIYVDDAKVGAVPVASVPVTSYGLTAPLAVGPHHWSVKALPAAGDAVSSSVSTFTIDPAGNWPDWAIGPFERYGGNPIVRPQGTGWEQVNTFNPGVLFDHGKFRMLYRAQGQKKGIAQVKDDGFSREGYAESLDGVTFVRNPEPIIDATEPFEKKYGCEDARFFKKDGVYYAFYTGNGPKGGVAICEATSSDGTTWKKLGPVVAGTKNAAMICDPNGSPVQINGNYAMFVGGAVCYSDDLIKWSPMTGIDLKLPADWVRSYEPCVAVTNYSSARPDDIVLFIAGTLNGKGKWFYAISEVLFSKKDLTQKVDQLNDCIMKPRELYESGTFKNCLWMNCIIQHEGQWMMYYGAGDRNVGLATAPVK
ncbi:MAG: hypothetical protein WBR21_15360 [Rouxiella badensis]|uniref:glycoside hydrolase family 130 protein n=1 Tax=Rouxiella badensis TaxID=1646377 RepID=UPI003C4D43DF